MESPAGFVRREVDGAVVVVRADLADALLAAGIADPEAVLARSPSELRGRGRLARLELGAAGRGVLRVLQRGGLVGRLVRRLSLDPDRAASELRVAAGAAARGARVLEVWAAISRPAGAGWHHALVTREVEGARDLLAVLREASPGPARWRALRAAGRAVRLLHEAGVDHVDLNVKNVLITPAGDGVVIDLDRCRMGPSPAPWSVQRGNLLRLLRSWTKLRVGEPGAVASRDPLAFLAGYARGERELRARLVSEGRRASFPWRRLLWSLARPRYA